MDAGKLATLIESVRPQLEGFLAQRGGAVLANETVDDLVQGVHMRALGAADHFEHRGDEEFRAWLFGLARHEIASRHEHWSALRRDAGTLLRLTWENSAATFTGVDPASPRTGPASFAQRREMMAVAVQAASTLQLRDRRVVALGPEATVADVARELGLSHDAAQRARLRALERFERAFGILTRARGGGR